VNKLVRNEQNKLTATYLNGIAVALFAVGGFAPLANFVAGSLSNGFLVLSLLFFAGCVALSGALHYFARSILRRLEE
jgi:hypothetical protein